MIYTKTIIDVAIIISPVRLNLKPTDTRRIFVKTVGVFGALAEASSQLKARLLLSFLAVFRGVKYAKDCIKEVPQERGRREVYFAVSHGN